MKIRIETEASHKKHLVGRWLTVHEIIGDKVSVLRDGSPDSLLDVVSVEDVAEWSYSRSQDLRQMYEVTQGFVGIQCKPKENDLRFIECLYQCT